MGAGNRDHVIVVDDATAMKLSGSPGLAHVTALLTRPRLRPIRNLLPHGPGRRAATSSHGPPGLSVHPETDPAMATLNVNEYTMRARFEIPGDRLKRRDAGSGVPGEPVPHLSGNPDGGEALRVSHGIQGLFPETAGAASRLTKIPTFRLEQPDAGSGSWFGYHHRRGHCPTRLLAEGSSINFRRA